MQHGPKKKTITFWSRSKSLVSSMILVTLSQTLSDSAFAFSGHRHSTMPYILKSCRQRPGSIVIEHNQCRNMMTPNNMMCSKYIQTDEVVTGAAMCIIIESTVGLGRELCSECFQFVYCSNVTFSCFEILCSCH